MRVAIIHGYFLHDSGSGIYTRELARELVREGHEVTLVCQDRRPEDYDFIDSAYELDAANRAITAIFERERQSAGSCRFVRPDLGGRLLTYVSGPFTGYEAKAFQDAPQEWIEAFLAANISALETIFSRWPVELVQANHLIMQPVIAARALAQKVPMVVTVHGSELNFTIRNDSRMVPYALEATAAATAIVTLSETSYQEVIELGISRDVRLDQKTHIVSPGVDTTVFIPRADRPALLNKFGVEAEAVKDEIAVFAGRLLWTKGLHYLIAAMPLILADHPRFRLLVAGEGPMREPLNGLIEMMGEGHLAEAQDLLWQDERLGQAPDYGPVLPEFSPESPEEDYRANARDLSGRIHFVGHLEHSALAELFATADISFAPSVFPEAFGLVSIEALAAGAIPLATYQSGLKTAVDAVHEILNEPAVRELTPGIRLTSGLASVAQLILEKYPTQDLSFRRSLHEFAEKRFSWAVVVEQMMRLAAIGYK